MSSFDKFDKQIAEGTMDAAMFEQSRAGAARTAQFSNFYRFVVLDVVFDPQIIDDDKIAHWEHGMGVRNIEHARALVRNTIIAQRVLEGTATEAEKPMFLFPMLPPTLALPCNPGEHVWAFFENKSVKRADLGYWLCRITCPGFVDDVNHTHAPRAYDPSFFPGAKGTHEGSTTGAHEFRPGAVVELSDGTRESIYETATLGGPDEKIYEKLLLESDAGRLRTYEAVPRFRKRPGDTAIEGANNALIVVGQHRVGAAAEYAERTDDGAVPSKPATDAAGPASGAIDIVVGRGQVPETRGELVVNSIGTNEVDKSLTAARTSEGDPDLSSDRSRVLLTQRSRVDVDMGLESFNGELSLQDREDGDGAVVVKSDKVRIIARSDVELLVQGFERDADGRMVASDDESRWAAIVIKSNGDIVLRPAVQGVLKLGGEDADKALLCTDQPAVVAAGRVTAPPLASTMGGLVGTNASGQGTFSTKILVV